MPTYLPPVTGSSAPAAASPRSAARGVLLRFLELQIPMVLGASLCYVLIRLIPDQLSAAVGYYPGTYLFAAADILYLNLPVAAWLVWRGYGWRRALEMAAAMLAPVIVIAVLGELARAPYLIWLLTAGYPAMALGMLAGLLYRRSDYSRPA